MGPPLFFVHQLRPLRLLICLSPVRWPFFSFWGSRVFVSLCFSCFQTLSFHFGPKKDNDFLLLTIVVHGRFRIFCQPFCRLFSSSRFQQGNFGDPSFFSTPAFLFRGSWFFFFLTAPTVPNVPTGPQTLPPYFEVPTLVFDSMSVFFTFWASKRAGRVGLCKQLFLV